MIIKSRIAGMVDITQKPINTVKITCVTSKKTFILCIVCVIIINAELDLERKKKLNKTLGTGSIDRSARVRRIKRVIIGLIVLAIVLPTVLCILLFCSKEALGK